jgi:Family of unknown function (DUF6572)
MAANPPIKDIKYIDKASRHDDGIDLFIMADGELDGSSGTQHLLLDKITSYLNQINTNEFREKFENPDPEKTRIVVLCDDVPHNNIEKMVEKAKPWVKDHNARLLIGLKRKQ